MSATVSPISFEQRPLAAGSWRIKLGVLDIGAIEQACGRVIWYVLLPPVIGIRYRRAATIEQAQGDARELVLQWIEAAELDTPARRPRETAVR